MQSTEGGFGLVIPDSDFLQFGASWLLVESKGRITKGRAESLYQSKSLLHHEPQHSPCVGRRACGAWAIAGVLIGAALRMGSTTDRFITISAAAPDPSGSRPKGLGK